MRADELRRLGPLHVKCSCLCLCVGEVWGAGMGRCSAAVRVIPVCVYVCVCVCARVCVVYWRRARKRVSAVRVRPSMYLLCVAKSFYISFFLYYQEATVVHQK